MTLFIQQLKEENDMNQNSCYFLFIFTGAQKRFRYLKLCICPYCFLLGTEWVVLVSSSVPSVICAETLGKQVRALLIQRYPDCIKMYHCFALADFNTIFSICGRHGSFLFSRFFCNFLYL